MRYLAKYVGDKESRLVSADSLKRAIPKAIASGKTLESLSDESGKVVWEAVTSHGINAGISLEDIELTTIDLEADGTVKQALRDAAIQKSMAASMRVFQQIAEQCDYDELELAIMIFQNEKTSRERSK